MSLGHPGPVPTLHLEGVHTTHKGVSEFTDLLDSDTDPAWICSGSIWICYMCHDPLIGYWAYRYIGTMEDLHGPDMVKTAQNGSKWPKWAILDPFWGSPDLDVHPTH